MKGKITKRGDSWTMMIDLPRNPVTGKRRQQRLTADSKREVEAMATKALAAIESGGFAEADAKKLTMEKYLEQSLESIRGNVNPITMRHYSDLVRLHINPAI